MVSVRAARLDEVRSVLDLWSEAEAEPTVTDDEGALAALMQRDGGIVLVAEINDRIVGTLLATFDGWRGHLYRLAVAPEYRRQGIASALVVEGEQRLITMGVARVDAIVVSDHGSATAFWSAVGYERQVQRLRFVKNLGS